MLKADGKKTHDAGNEEEDGCSKQSNPNEDRNRLSPADGMESSDILVAKKENLSECEEESYLNQKQSQEVPNKLPPQGDMTQNVVKVQPGVNNSKSNSNNHPANHGTLYSDSNKDYKGELRDETPSKTEHLENEHDETGKKGFNSEFGQNNPAGQKKINSKDSQASGDKQTTKSCQSQNIHQEKKNPTERTSVFDGRLGKKNEEPEHSGHQNVSYVG